MSADSTFPLPDNSSPLRVCSFESRKGEEIRSLLERNGLKPTIAPSMQEIPREDNPEVFGFGTELFAGRVDVIVFMTGVGARALMDVLVTRHSEAEILEALARCCVIVRGPKPAAVLREWKLKFDHLVPEPNTWRELLGLLDEKVPVSGKTVAVQEYGQPNAEFYSELEKRGAKVLPVPVYRWALPDETGALRQAVHSTITGDFDVLMITSAQQVHHLLTIAGEEGVLELFLEAARKCVIASIGPTASETLAAVGLPASFEPEHPKMGHLVRETAASAPAILMKLRDSSA